MTEDLTGTWEGIYSTGTAPSYSAYGGAFEGFDRDPRIQRADNVAAADHRVRLVIASQSDYRKFVPNRAPLVSIVTGQMDYFVWDMSAPIGGFVDDSGLVSLSIYKSDPRGDEVFVGRLTHRGLTRDISGNLMLRVTPPGTGWPDLYTD
jgi:hypothetical protein